MKNFDLHLMDPHGISYAFDTGFSQSTRKNCAEIMLNLRAICYHNLSTCTDVGVEMCKYLNQMDPKAHWIYREDLSCDYQWNFVLQNTLKDVGIETWFLDIICKWQC